MQLLIHYKCFYVQCILISGGRCVLSSHKFRDIHWAILSLLRIYRNEIIYYKSIYFSFLHLSLFFIYTFFHSPAISYIFLLQLSSCFTERVENLSTSRITFTILLVVRLTTSFPVSNEPFIFIATWRPLGFWWENFILRCQAMQF